MTSAIVFFLIVIVLLLCEPVAGRPRLLTRLMLVGAALWVSVKIDLGGLIMGLLALTWEHWPKVVLTAGATFLLGLLVYLIYCAVHDQLDNRAIRKEWRESRGDHTN